MKIHEAVVMRILQLCETQDITPNGLSNKSGVPQGTVKSILNGESMNPGIVNLKKLCDGFDISITEFFDTDYFRCLEQEME